MEHELFHALLPIASNIVYVALSMAVGFLWNKAKGLQENREKTEDGVRALLKRPFNRDPQQRYEKAVYYLHRNGACINNV